MNLKTLIIACISVAPLVALADEANNPFAGIFGGIGLGYTAVKAKIDIPALPFSTKVHESGLNSEVFGGYNYALTSNWLIGAQLSFDYNEAKVNQSMLGGAITGKLNPIYRVNGLLGYTFNQSIMIFTGLGYSMGRLKVNMEPPNTSNNINGWTGLIGAQEALVDSLSIRETFDYTDYKSKMIGTTPIGMSDYAVDVKTSSYAGMVSLVYTFDM